MGFGRAEQIAVTAPDTEKGAGKNWLEMLRQWLVQCPQCGQVRLVVGAHENDRYVCKDCGHGFAIKRSMATTKKPTL